MQTPLHNEIDAFMTGLTFAMPRLIAMFLIVPLFSRQVLPGMLRNCVALSVALVVAPMLAEQGLKDTDHGLFGLAALVMKEVLIGVMLGFAVAVPLWAFEALGYLIDTQRGASIASVLDPVTGHDTSPLGVLFGQAMIVFFFVSGAYLQMLGLIYESFRVWPVDDWWPVFGSQAPAVFLGMMDHFMKLAVLLAAPVIVAMFLAEIGLAIVGRSAPQMDVFFLAMPVKSGVAILMLALYVGVLFDYVGQELARIPATLSALLPAFAR